MTAKRPLLIIDDEKNMCHMLSLLLASHGYQISTATSGAEGLNQLKETPFDFVLCDIKMPNMDGLAFLERALNQVPNLTVIMMSAYGTVDTAVKAMKLGAYDFISKPFKTDEITVILEKAQAWNQLQQENNQLKQQLSHVEQAAGFGKLIGKSQAMQSLFQFSSKAARHKSTVLITGPSGTGKELLAQAIHAHSPRAQYPFLAVNCGSIPENLLESEFFGYQRGAFTGADRSQTGLFVAAEQGTLFLDEIGELPLTLQVKLLRVLQEERVRPLGAQKEQPINVRIIAATARNLETEVADGHFRQDLFFRLNVLHLCLPPLQARPEDIPLLANHFLKKINQRLDLQVESITPKAMALLLSHDWPGNVRELENMIERALILADKAHILPENLPTGLGGRVEQRRIDDFFDTLSLKKARRILEERLIRRALSVSEGNKSQAARLLEISYPSLLSKIKSLAIDEHTITTEKEQ